MQGNGLRRTLSGEMPGYNRLDQYNRGAETEMCLLEIDDGSTLDETTFWMASFSGV